MIQGYLLFSLRLSRVLLAGQVSTKKSDTADTMIRKTHQLDDREIVRMVC